MPVRFAFATRDEGQFRLPPLHIWNVRIGHPLRFGSLRAETAVDILNVTNHDADQALQPGANQIFSSLYGQSGVRQFPRAVQLSARLAF